MIEINTSASPQMKVTGTYSSKKKKSHGSSLLKTLSKIQYLIDIYCSYVTLNFVWDLPTNLTTQEKNKLRNIIIDSKNCKLRGTIKY